MSNHRHKRLMNSLMICCLILSCVAASCCWASEAQTDVRASAVEAAPFTIKSVPHWNGGQLPYVLSNNPSVDYRINNVIFISMIGQPAPKVAEDGLIKPAIRKTTGWFGDYSFVVDRNDSRLLSLTIYESECGATCGVADSKFLFDSATGRRVSITDIFSAEGRQALGKRNSLKRTERLQQEVDQLRKEISSEPTTSNSEVSDESSDVINDDTEDDYENGDIDSPRFWIHEYERCIKESASKDSSQYEAIESDQMTLGVEKVTFVHHQCYNGYGWYKDEVGRQALSYSFSELRPYVSAYGLYVLLGEGKYSLPLSPFEQVLRGYIGKAPITMYLREPERLFVSGFYFYEKNRGTISLTGKLEGKNIVLTERDEQVDYKTGAPQPVIRATINGETLEGFWEGEKKLRFKVVPATSNPKPATIP